MKDFTVVFGAMRSGTTVFRLMLDAHPALFNVGEADFLFDHLVRDGSAWRYDMDLLRRDRIFRRYALDLPQGLDGLDLLEAMLAQLRGRGTGRFSVNLHRDIERVVELYPDVRIVHMVRDPRDVARSIMEMGWSGTLYHAVDHWVEVESAWERLRPTIAPERRIDLAYEALFRDTEGELRRVCAFLGVAFDPAMLDYHLATTYGPPDPKLVEQWRRKGDPVAIRQLEVKAGALMQARGYELSAPVGAPPGPVGALRLHLAHKLYRMRFGMRRFGPGLYLRSRLARLLGSRAMILRTEQERQEIVNRSLK